MSGLLHTCRSNRISSPLQLSLCPVTRFTAYKHYDQQPTDADSAGSLLTDGVGSQIPELYKHTEPGGQQVGKTLLASRQVQSCGDRDCGRHHSVPAQIAEALPSRMKAMVVLHSDIVGSDAGESIESRLESIDSKVRCVG